MSTSRFTPARLLTVLALVATLTVTLLAASVAGPAAPRASAMVSAAKGEHALDWARTRKGSPYHWGATGPRRFDCSGLTRWAYARVGRSLPRSSSAQAGKARRIDRQHKRRGDLVFFYSRGGIYHVGIYAGRGNVWHAARPGTRVRRDQIWTSRVFFGRVR